MIYIMIHCMVSLYVESLKIKSQQNVGKWFTGAGVGGNRERLVKGYKFSVIRFMRM